MAEGLFITVKRLVQLTPLSGDIDQDKITPFIKSGQDLHIEPLLGTRLFEKIKADIEGGTLAGDYLTLTQTYIQPVLAHLAAADFYQFHVYQIQNGGIFKHESENSISIDKNEVDRLVQHERDIAGRYMQKLDNPLGYFAPTLYPEYSQATADEESPEPARRNRGGIYLG